MSRDTQRSKNLTDVLKGTSKSYTFHLHMEIRCMFPLVSFPVFDIDLRDGTFICLVTYVKTQKMMFTTLEPYNE